MIPVPAALYPAIIMGLACYVGYFVRVRWPFYILLAFSLIVSFAFNHLQPLGAAALGALAFSAWLYSRKGWQRHVGFVLTFLGLLVFAAHQVPGIRNLLYVKQIRFSPGAMSYDFYINFDKTLAALIVFAIAVSGKQLHLQMSILAKRLLVYYPIVFLVMVGAAISSGYVQFEPKWPNHVWLWAFNNLLFVCAAEELIFRGILQRYLSTLKYVGSWGALVIASVAFGAAHYKGGLTYVILSAVAGLFYGHIYKVSQNLMASIYLHFLLNLTHLLLFTYPALAK